MPHLDASLRHSDRIRFLALRHRSAHARAGRRAGSAAAGHAMGGRPVQMDIEAGELEMRHLVARLAERDEALLDSDAVQRRTLQPGIDAAAAQQFHRARIGPQGTSS